jgi:predicted nucleic acid-binding protein
LSFTRFQKVEAARREKETVEARQKAAVARLEKARGSKEQYVISARLADEAFAVLEREKADVQKKLDKVAARVKQAHLNNVELSGDPLLSRNVDQHFQRIMSFCFRFFFLLHSHPTSQLFHPT